MGIQSLQVSQNMLSMFGHYSRLAARRLNRLFAQMQDPAPAPSDGTGKAAAAGAGIAAGGIALVVIGIVILCLIPVCVIVILALLGPAVGNVFSEINESI